MNYDFVFYLEGKKVLRLHIFIIEDKHSSIFVQGYTMSGRKRKSLWDSKEETEIPAEFRKHDARHGRGNHYSHRAKWSELEANDALKSNNCSRWASSETWQDNNGRRDFNEIPETKRAVNGAKSYSRSPGFNERGRQDHSPSSEIYWSQSHRYQRRSRSSSRSKGRAGSRSRSRSRGRDRDMDKDTDGTRSWSRGRDRNMDQERDTNWSRSSLCDQRRENNGMGDRNRGARVSSQLCRDFAVGMCRRGGQCRFLHQDNLNLRDGGKPERERAEIWSGRHDTSETFSADNERLRYRPPDKVSHYNRSNRSSSFDHDHMRQPHKNSNIPCRYFAMGRCHRDDCRFSHDHSRGGGVKERLQYDRYPQHSDDENKYRNGPKWGDAKGVSDMNINEWTGSDAGNMNYKDRTTAKKHPYDRLNQDLKDENISWNGPKWSDVSDVARPNQWVDSNAGSVIFPEPPIAEMKTDERPGNSMDHMTRNTIQNVDNGANLDTIELKGGATFGREVWLHAHGSHFQTVDGMPSQTYEKVIEGAPTQQPTNNVGHPLVSETSYVQQHVSKRDNNDMSTDDSNALNGVSISGNTMQLPVPDQSFNQNRGTFYEKVIDGPSTQQLTNNVGHPLVSETSYVQQHDSKRGNNDMSTDDSNALNGVSISENTMQLLVPDQGFNQNRGSLGSMPFKFHDTDPRNAIPVSPSKGHEIDPNRSDKLYLSSQDESKILCEESTNKQQVFESELPQVDPGLPQNDMTSYQVPTVTNLSASLNEIFSNGKQLPELYAALNLKNSTDLSTSLSCSASVNCPVASTVGQPNPTTLFQEQHVLIGDTIEPSKHDKSDKPYEQGKPNPSVSPLPSFTEGISKHVSDNKPFEQEKPTPLGNLLLSVDDRISEDANNNKPYELGEQKPVDQFLSSSTAGPDSRKHQKICSPVKECQGSPKLKQLKSGINLEAHQNFSVKAEKCKPEEEIPSGNANPEGGIREGNCGNDEKEMRLFKVALVEYVKEILKPTWKEGQMSREVHKSIVKKVVDKVTSTIQGVHVPKTQEKVDQYLACSKPKLTKLVQAYTERLLKS